MQLLHVEWRSSDASEDDLANSSTLAAIAKELLEMAHACRMHSVRRRNAWCNKAQCMV
jgi:cell division protein FtsL